MLTKTDAKVIKVIGKSNETDINMKDKTSWPNGALQMKKVFFIFENHIQCNSPYQQLD